MKKESQEGEYLKDLDEWQEKQYLPGHYVGGKLPPAIKYPTRRLGWLFLIMVLPIFIVSLVSGLVNDFSIPSIETIGWGGLVPVLLVILYLAIGIKLLVKANKKK